MKRGDLIITPATMYMYDFPRKTSSEIPTQIGKNKYGLILNENTRGIWINVLIEGKTGWMNWTLLKVLHSQQM